MAKKEEKPKDWWEEFGFLTPDEQRWIMAEQGYEPIGTTDSGFGEFGGFGGDEYVDELANYPLAGVGAIPEYTTKGNLDPRDLTQVAKGINVAQDYGALLLDNILSGIAGPGSYDVGAFQPEIEYGKEITRPGYDRLTAMAGRGGWEGYIAKQMLENGASASEAIARMQNFVETSDENDPDLDPKIRAEVRALKASLPKAKQDPLQFVGGVGMRGGEQGTDFDSMYNMDRIWQQANDWDEALFNDPAFAYSEPDASGRMHYYDTAPETIKTPQMEFFDKYGLPYPTARYDEPKYMEAYQAATWGTPEQRAADVNQWTRDYQSAATDVNQRARAQQDQALYDRQMQEAWNRVIPAVPEARGGWSTTEGAPGKPATRHRERGPNGTAILVEDTAVPPTIPTSYWDPHKLIQAAAPARNVPQVQASTGDNLMLAPSAFSDAYKQRGGHMDERTQGGIDWFTGRKAEGDTRRMKASDVSPEARQRRTNDLARQRINAEERQQYISYSDPQLDSIRQFIALRGLAQSGRTPFQDAIAQRRMGARALGL